MTLSLIQSDKKTKEIKKMTNNNDDDSQNNSDNKEKKKVKMLHNKIKKMQIKKKIKTNITKKMTK